MVCMGSQGVWFVNCHVSLCAADKPMVLFHLFLCVATINRATILQKSYNLSLRSVNT